MEIIIISGVGLFLIIVVLLIFNKLFGKNWNEETGKLSGYSFIVITIIGGGYKVYQDTKEDEWRKNQETKEQIQQYETEAQTFKATLELVEEPVFGDFYDIWVPQDKILPNNKIVIEKPPFLWLQGRYGEFFPGNIYETKCFLRLRNSGNSTATILAIFFNDVNFSYEKKTNLDSLNKLLLEKKFNHHCI